MPGASEAPCGPGLVSARQDEPGGTNWEYGPPVPQHRALQEPWLFRPAKQRLKGSKRADFWLLLQFSEHKNTRLSCPSRSPGLSGPTPCSCTFSALPLTPVTLGSLTACHSLEGASSLPPLGLCWNAPQVWLHPLAVLPGPPQVGLWPIAYCALSISAITAILTSPSNCP